MFVGTLLLIIHVLVAVLICIVILMQSSKGQGLSGAFGMGEGTTSFFGADTANVLVKITTALAVTFMLTSLALAYYQAQHAKSVTAGKSATPEAAAVAAPPGDDDDDAIAPDTDGVEPDETPTTGIDDEATAPDGDGTSPDGEMPEMDDDATDAGTGDTGAETGTGENPDDATDTGPDEPTEPGPIDS